MQTNQGYTGQYRNSEKNIKKKQHKVVLENNSAQGRLQKKTGYFMTLCQRVGRQQSQNMISFLKEIMTRGWMPESLVR